MNIRCIILGTTFALASAGPALAGPCTARLAELEKSIQAKHEGAGPALADTGTPASTAAERRGDTEAMQMLQQAKQLDQQGKEKECMQAIAMIEV